MSVLHSSHQTWRQPFQEFALQWLDAIGHYFRTLIPQLVSHDEWNAVEVNVSEAQERTHQMRPGRLTTPGSLGRKSASLPSLTPSKHSAFKTVGSSYGTPSKVRYWYLEWNCCLCSCPQTLYFVSSWVRQDRNRSKILNQYVLSAVRFVNLGINFIELNSSQK